MRSGGHRLPAGPRTSVPSLEDGYQALQWLHEAADELQLPRGPIAVAGESGHLQVPVGQTFPLADVQQAFEHLTTKHTTGKIVSVP